MHAYLVVGNKDSIDQEVSRMTDGKKLEFPFVKIADLRELNNFTKLKLTQKTAIILKDFDKASVEAQNAFLKSLEEPQENLTYILSATNIEKVLPTIISRCEVIELKINNLQFTIEEKQKVEDFIKSDIGNKLKIVSKITKREEAIEFAEKLIIVGHQETYNFQIPIFKLLEEALKLKSNLEANGNVLLQLVNFVINIS